MLLRHCAIYIEGAIISK